MNSEAPFTTPDGRAMVTLALSELDAIGAVLTGRRAPSAFEREVIGNQFLLWAAKARREQHAAPITT